MNCITIIGNLTRDPENRTTPNGKSVCSFDVAVKRRKQVEGQPEADYFRCNAWNALADLCGKYLGKGKKVMVTGPVSLSKREHDGKFYASIEVLVNDVEFLTPKQTDSQTGMEVVNDDDMPF